MFIFYSKNCHLEYTMVKANITKYNPTLSNNKLLWFINCYVIGDNDRKLFFMCLNEFEDWEGDMNIIRMYNIWSVFFLDITLL